MSFLSLNCYHRAVKPKETLIARLASLGITLTGKIHKMTISRDKIKVIVDTDEGQLPIEFPVELLGQAYTVGRVKPNDKIWEREGWLAQAYRREGGFQYIGKKYDLEDPGQLSAMRRYAHDVLRWRRAEGTIVQRWEFINRYYAAVEHKERPRAKAVAEALGIVYTSSHHYKQRALKGNFFGAYLDQDRLEEMQGYLHKEEPYVLFPDKEEQPNLGHFTLLRAKGYPNLPAGLLSDLLTRLEPSFISASQKGREVLFTLRCHEEIVFTAELLEGELWDADQTGPFAVGSVNKKLGVLCFSLGDASFTGKISAVVRASSGAPYGPCLQDEETTV